MIDPTLRLSMEGELRRLLADGKHQGQDYARREARLIKIIEDFNIDGCPLHGATCPEPARCLADEILSRALAWV